MLPYVELPYLRLGPLYIGTTRVLIALGILVAHALLIRRARAAGRDGSLAAWLSLWMVLGGAVGAHLFKLLYIPQAGTILARYPWFAVQIFNGMASFGGIFGGLLAGVVYLRCRRTTAREALGYLDVVAWAFPFGWVFGRIGCALVHDHSGVWSSSWLAVQYPGGSRYDLAVLEVFFLLPVLALFVALDRRRRPDGFYLGLFLLVYGAFRVALDGLHVDVVRYFGWSVDQYAGTVAVLAGAGVLLAIHPLRRGAARPDWVVTGGSS